MNVLAVNSSPLMGEGNTAKILNPFLEGMKDAGAHVELFYTKKLKINPCQGEFRCWINTPGECFQKDDMQMLHPKLEDAEIWVFATPVYVDAVSGPMKNLMDRIIPVAQPFIELRDGHCRHPLREGVKVGKVALVSNCGFWEMDNFDPLLVHMKAACKNLNREFAGALLRPHGPGLDIVVEMGQSLDDIFDAAKEAGRQLVKNGKISTETLDVVSRELMPQEVYVQIINKVFEEERAAARKK
jgi:multimeric flavodoxin WrbA